MSAELQRSGPVQDFLRSLARLNRIEAQGRAQHSEEVLKEHAERTAALAKGVAKLLGEPRWQALALWIADHAIQRLESSNDAALQAKTPWPTYISSLTSKARLELREELGAFTEQVMIPTDLLPTTEGAVLGWKATARSLFALRILAMAQAQAPQPIHRLLPLPHQRLYLRWKVERATSARHESRMEALRHLVSIELSYPAADAESWISGTPQK